MNTEAAAIAALAERAAVPQVIDVAGVPVLVAPAGWQKEKYDAEAMKPRPARSRGGVPLATVDSLARYIALRDRSETQIFTQRLRFSVVAVFNPHTKDEAGWCDDTAGLQFSIDPCLDRWQKLAGKWQTQEAFSNFLRERGPDIATPDAGTVLDLVENLETHTQVKGKFSRRAQDGSFTINWEEETRAKTQVPDKFTLRLPCFLLSETMLEVECRLNFRAQDAVLHWQFLIDDFEAALDAAWDAEMEKLRNHEALPAGVKERIFSAAWPDGNATIKVR